MAGTHDFLEHLSQNFTGEESPADFFYRAIALTEKNNTHDFVRLFNLLESDKQKEVIKGICDNDAANCLAKVLDGEAGDQSMIDYYLSDLANNMPLHHAAKEAAPRIAALFLDKGHSFDLRTDFNSVNISLKNVLPLNVALYYRSYRLWLMDGWRSPIHQIIILCQSFRYSKTIRVFARNTPELKNEFLKYLKQGKVIEVGALLATASDLIMSPSSTIDGENGSIGFKNIMEMRQFLLAEISRSLDGSSTKELKKTLQLLEIFDRFGDKLHEHMPMWDEEEDEYYYDDDELENNKRNNAVASLIENAAKDEKTEIEDHDDEVLRFSDTAKTSPDDVKIAWKISKQLRGFTRKFSTKAYAPSWLEERSSRVDFSRPLSNFTRKFSTNAYSPSWLEERSSLDVPSPLPIEAQYLALKGARTPMTKYVLSKKHAFAKVVRHLRYL